MRVGDRSPRIADGKMRALVRGRDLNEKAGANTARSST
jgi:hypothetical protein